MNPDLSQLHPYPFEKLARLFSDLTPPADLKPIALSIGEPKHPSPDFVMRTINQQSKHLATYPTTKGIPELRQAIAAWLQRRFRLVHLDAETQILPVNGTREALFSFTQAVVNRQTRPLVMMPNPFYQIYEGAAFLAGAEPWYLPCTAETGFIPDFDAVPAEIWQQTQLLFICSPGNPTGAVIPRDKLVRLLELSDQYGFVIASDECYSEIYFDETDPPVGLLQVCAETGRHDYRNCVVFHSLSKRSNVPGLRSGFVAGDASILKPYLLYRTYHGSAMPVQHQWASIMAWLDEGHVIQNRALYRQKFKAFRDILDPVLPLQMPDAGFYFWADTPTDDESFARLLFGQAHVTVLPGRYLGRTVDGLNPGENRVRMALVASLNDCVAAAERIKALL
ncbi:succinyldiaminopimelate aminotransferase [Fluviicoccus keumensis]|uniref:Succinyldiaminopimelate aminotransferase n=1 Tax=Fluviicoccus keumensis TaxID=1435465 RepID=A0A4Q7YIY1_9GAMM|nr:succinyldiaminopimelate transaminase [Fluviicoccus keumensis]RZU37118.1 succinyldiaminopimelate aminotransferase [Fluviicoccus keumensis]